jgi:hypothetical protein
MTTPAGQEALHQLAHGEDITTVSSAANLSADVVSFLRMQYLVEGGVSRAQLHRVSPLFNFDSFYSELINTHFGQFPRSLKNQLAKCWNPAVFARISIHNSHYALDAFPVPIDSTILFKLVHSQLHSTTAWEHSRFFNC